MKTVLLISMPSGGEWITMVLAGTFLFIVPAIFYILTLQNTLNLISDKNRKMPSTNVWLLLIPFFGIIWHFIVVGKIAESIEAEYQSRNLPVQHKPTYNMGLAVSILNCVSLIPVINIISFMAAFICWIVYWAQVNTQKNKLFHLILSNSAQKNEM